MRSNSVAILLSTVLCTALALPAGAATFDDVTMPDSVQVAGQTLVLNGMGLREKFFIDVYVAGLYLPQKQTSGQAILSSDTPRRTVMHFVFSVGKGKICDAWDESLEANYPKASEALEKDFKTLCSWMADIGKGEDMVFTYVPGTGTQVEVKGETKGTIEGKDFADALFAAWIGKHPATSKLKKGLLGG